LGAALLRPSLHRLVVYEPPLNIDITVVEEEALAEVEAAAATGDLGRIVGVGLRRCVRLPDHLVDALRRTRRWPFMVQHAAKWPLELRALRGMEPGAERYRTISVPTLLVAGERTPIRHHHRVGVDALSAVLPDARLVEIGSSGHEAHLEAPDALAAELKRFLR
jgi:pimeloyl-ACP methyl ester carboxylesterase